MGLLDNLDYNWKELLLGGVVGYFAGNKKAGNKIKKQIKAHMKDFLDEQEDDVKPKKKKK